MSSHPLLCNSTQFPNSTMFWHAVDIQLVLESVDYVQKSLKKVLERNTSPEDIKLMQDSMYHLSVSDVTIILHVIDISNLFFF